MPENKRRVCTVYDTRVFLCDQRLSTPNVPIYQFPNLLNLHHHYRVLPQIFEVVEAASRRVKYVDYDVTVVDQRPAGIVTAFGGMQRKQTSLLLQFRRDRVYDSLGLTCAL